MLKNVYYINLEKRKDRKELVENELNELGWEYKRFNAIKTTNGQVGCTMSHLKLIQLAKEKDLDYIVIVEDDIQFMRKSWYNKKITEIISNSNTKFSSRITNNFDVFLLGGNLRPPIGKINEDIYRITNSFTTTGYIVKKHYYDTLINNFKNGLELLLRNPHLAKADYNPYALDVYWMKLQAKDNWLIIMPRTITQRPIYSDIEQRYVDYNHLMLDDMSNIPSEYNVKLIDKLCEHEQSFFKPKKIDLLRLNPVKNDVVVFTDYSVNLHNTYFKNIALLIEPPEITKQSYDYVFDNIDKYDLILTHNKKLLDLNNDKVKLNLYGTTWLHESYQKIYKKSKLCSIIASTKIITSGHKLRHSILEYLVKENINVDKYGGKFIQLSTSKTKPHTMEHTPKHETNEKILGLKDYMFSIIIENFKEDYWFTEKLTDCLLSGTIPIYWGCPSIGDFFNINGMIIFDTLDELKEILNNLTIEKYKSMELYIKENFEKASKNYQKYNINEDEIIKLF